MKRVRRPEAASKLNEFNRELKSEKVLARVAETIGKSPQQADAEAGQILAALREIGAETEKFGGSLSVLTRHIKNAAASSDDVNTRFSRLSSRITNVQTIEEKVVKKIIANPNPFHKSL